MDSLRRHGSPPFTVAVVHGGPGAAGDMRPVAEELSACVGVLEPLQTANSIDRQVQDLKTILENRADFPVILIGHSWGAWLSFILTARHQQLVKKLILVGSAPFEEKYAGGVLETRLSRLDEKTAAAARALMKDLDDPATENKHEIMARLAPLLSVADNFDAATNENQPLGFQQEIFQAVWPQAAELRRSGKLVKLGESIQCPVVAIHGDYDPHPAAGVKEPLAKTIEDFRFVLLKNCGHKPWIEKTARTKLFQILERELSC